MEASIKDLRLHTRTLIAATDRGEEVVITWHGRPCARLVPLGDAPAAGSAAGRNPAFGLWSDRSGSVDEEVRRLRRGRFSS